VLVRQVLVYRMAAENMYSMPMRAPERPSPTELPGRSSLPRWESPSCAGYIGLRPRIGDRSSKHAERLADGNFGPSLSLDVGASVRLYCNVLAPECGRRTQAPNLLIWVHEISRRGGTVYAAVSKIAPHYGVVGSNPTAGTLSNPLDFSIPCKLSLALVAWCFMLYG
jgi:hypothetical protein